MKHGGIYVAQERGCGCRTAALFAEQCSKRERNKILARWIDGGRDVLKVADERVRIRQCPHQVPPVATLCPECAGDSRDGIGHHSFDCSLRPALAASRNATGPPASERLDGGTS